jgi:uncharacterized protein (TIGR00288 family)
LKKKIEERVAIFVDGPNVLRKEFMIDLREVRRRAEKYGRVIIAKVFLNQFAPEKLIEAIVNEGFKVEMVMAEEENGDVDVSLALSAIEAILVRDIDVVILTTRDADFIPVVHKAKEYGKKVVIFGVEPGFSAALKNAADKVEYL